MSRFYREVRAKSTLQKKGPAREAVVVPTRNVLDSYIDTIHRLHSSFNQIQQYKPPMEAQPVIDILDQFYSRRNDRATKSTS